MVKRVKSIQSRKEAVDNNKFKKNKINDISDKQFPILIFLEKYSFLFFFILISLMLIFVFREYIFLNSLFLFKDIGSDTVNTFYPSYVLMSDLSGNDLAYTFRNGMGAAVGGSSQIFGNGILKIILNPFNYFLNLWDGTRIAYGLGITELLKIFVAAIIFFYYLKTLRLTKYVVLTGTLIFAFSGFMIGGSGWYQHTIQLVYVALLLFAFEQALLKKRFLIFLVVIMMVFRALNPFYVYVFGIFIIFYSLMRVIQEKRNFKEAFAFYLKIGLATIVAFLINLPFLYQRIQSILQDPRVSGNLNKVEQMQNISVFAIGDFLHNVTAFLRLYSNDILGTGQINEHFVNGQRYLISDFKGYYNYYEAPMFYIGIVSLILFPQIFAFGKRKERIIYAVFIIIWIIPVIFPYFRRAYFLFFGDYYRAFSFFLPFAILYPALQTLNRLYKENKINIPLLWITALLLLVLMYFPYFSEQKLSELNLQTNPINESVRFIISLVIIAEALFFTVIVKKTKYRISLFYFTGVLIIAELVYTSNITLNERDTVSVKEFESKKGYNDYTIDAISYLQSNDSTFYRTEKDYSSGFAVHGSLNDAKVQGYYGTTSYASHQNPYYIDFMQQSEIIPFGDETAARWSTGVRSRPLLAVMTNVKYMLSKTKTPYFLQFGYEQIHTAGDVGVYRNKFSLPLGYTYSKMIKRSEFETLSVLQKDICMLNAVVLQDSMINKFSGIEIYKPLAEPNYSKEQLGLDVAELSDKSLKIDSFRDDHIIGKLELTNPRILFFSILFDKNWEIKINGKMQDAFLSNIAFTGIYLEEGNYDIELIYERKKAVTGSVLSNILFILFLIAGISYEVLNKKKKK